MVPPKLLVLALLLAIAHGQACPILQLKAALNRKRVLLGGTAKLTVTARNAGTTTAADTVVQVVLPPGFYPSLSTEKAWGHVAAGHPTFTQDGATLRWAYAALPPKTRVKLSIAVWVDACAVPTALAAIGISAYQLVGGVPTCTVTGPTPTVRGYANGVGCGGAAVMPTYAPVGRPAKLTYIRTYTHR